jgi:EAL domain-containing protein (putative c-di-GMP-specific phosphodiesterase class I)
MFAAAEAAGREVELSMLCREQAVVHSVCLPARLPLFMNTHPAEDLMVEVVPQMQRLREQWPGRPMVLEIHEGAIMEPGLVRNVRAALREVDVQLAFDDFGAGQARFRELICVPSDYIKFDSALIHDLVDLSKEQFGFFKSIINGVKGEGLLTVAEGIENERMIEVCREVGFDLVQRFALSRPTIMTTLDDDDEDTVELLT